MNTFVSSSGTHFGSQSCCMSRQAFFQTLQNSPCCHCHKPTALAATHAQAMVHRWWYALEFKLKPIPPKTFSFLNILIHPQVSDAEAGVFLWDCNQAAVIYEMFVWWCTSSVPDASDYCLKEFSFSTRVFIRPIEIVGYHIDTESLSISRYRYPANIFYFM